MAYYQARHLAPALSGAVDNLSRTVKAVNAMKFQHLTNQARQRHEKDMQSSTQRHQAATQSRNLDRDYAQLEEKKRYNTMMGDYYETMGGNQTRQTDVVVNKHNAERDLAESPVGMEDVQGLRQGGYQKTANLVENMMRNGASRERIQEEKLLSMQLENQAKMNAENAGV